jgi:hypothetical protein
MKAFISADSTAPDDKAIRRGKDNIKQLGGGGDYSDTASAFSGMSSP